VKAGFGAGKDPTIPSVGAGDPKLVLVSVAPSVPGTDCELPNKPNEKVRAAVEPTGGSGLPPNTSAGGAGAGPNPKANAGSCVRPIILPVVAALRPKIKPDSVTPATVEGALLSPVVAVPRPTLMESWRRSSSKESPS
jgi:hypothetical protein